MNVSKLACPGRTLEIEFEIPLKILRFFREIRHLLFFYCIIVQAASVFENDSCKNLENNSTCFSVRCEIFLL